MTENAIPNSKDFNSSELDDIVSVATKLPASEKAKLVQKLLGTDGMTVIFGNGLTTAQVVIQIQSMEKLDLSSIMEALSDRIASDAK